MMNVFGNDYGEGKKRNRKIFSIIARDFITLPGKVGSRDEERVSRTHPLPKKEKKKMYLTLKNAQEKKEASTVRNKLPRGYRDVLWMCLGQDTEFSAKGSPLRSALNGPTTSRPEPFSSSLKSIVGHRYSKSSTN